MMGTDGCPSVGDGVGGLSPFYGQWRFPAAIGSQERLSLGIVAGELLGTGKLGKVIASFPVFCLVVDGCAKYLDFADVEVALEIGGIIPGVPEAEFDA